MSTTKRESQTAQAQHTPLPWVWSDAMEIGHGPCRPCIYGPSELLAGDKIEQLICVCDSQGLYHRGATEEHMNTEARSNAALIVQAVNSHDDLLAVVVGMLQDFAPYVADDEDPEIRQRNEAWLNAARTAIAEAGA